jgi:NYN domain
MDRCALFVDAGYVLADGAMAVHGTRHRESVSWDYAGLLQFLGDVARDRTGLPLLRCYWYEATVEGRRSPEHDALADLPGVKLRLGRMRPGRREGVESEIHRDLATLARNGALQDALVVSAEEDLAQAIADVQDLGLRVTIVHITVDGNWTISRALRQECDDIVEIGEAHLRPYVELVMGAEPVREDERRTAGAPAGRAQTNGHGPVGSLGHQQALPAGAHTATPEIYTAPVIAEYQRAAQPAMNGQPVSPAGDRSGPPALTAPGLPPGPPGQPGQSQAAPPAPAGSTQPGMPVMPDLPPSPGMGAQPPQPAQAAMPTAQQAPAPPGPPQPSPAQPGPPAAQNAMAAPNAVATQLPPGLPQPAAAPGMPGQPGPQQPAPALQPLPAPLAQPGNSGAMPVLPSMPPGAPGQPGPPAVMGQPGMPGQPGQPVMQPPAGVVAHQGPPGMPPQQAGPAGPGGMPGYPALPPGYQGPGPDPQAGPGDAGPRHASGQHQAATGPQPQPPQAFAGQPSPPAAAHPGLPGPGGQPGQSGPVGPAGPPAVQQPRGAGRAHPQGAPPGRFARGPQDQRMPQPPQPPQQFPGPADLPDSGAYLAPQMPYGGPPAAAPLAPVQQSALVSLADAVQAAHGEGFNFGQAVARDAPALWLEAVLARKPRMPSDLEARLLQDSALPIDSLLHDEVRHALRRGFWDALERARH